MGVVLKNNAASTITTTISASDVGLAVAAGAGSLFPALGAGDYFYATLVSSGGTYEVVKVTARVGDTMTVVRAQEGTTAQSFASGSRIELRVTAAAVRDGIADAIPPRLDIADITALRAKTWPTGRPSVVNLASLVTPGDDGALFYWDSTSTAADNGTTVIKETATTTGRWLRQYIGLFTTLRSAVRTEDFTSAGQTPTQRRVSIQAAIDEAVARGTWLQIAQETHDIDGTSLTIPSSLIVEGRGSRSVIRSSVDRNTSPVLMVTGGDVRLRDFTITSTFAGSPAPGSNNSAITFLNGTGIEATGIQVNGKFYVGITLDGVTEALVKECRIAGPENRGIYLYRNTWDARIIDNVIKGGGTLAYGINVNPGGVSSPRRVSITNNQISGFAFHGIGTSENARDVSIVGNQVATTVSGAVCILVQAANTFYAGNTTVQGNTVRGGQIGIYATEVIFGLSITGNIAESQTGVSSAGIWVSDVYYASIIGNYVGGSPSNGIYASGSLADTCRRLSIIGNQVVGPTNGIYIYADVANATRDVTVTGNGTFGCPGNGLIANVNTDRVIMLGNNSRGNGTNIANAGTNAVTADNLTI